MKLVTQKQYNLDKENEQNAHSKTYCNCNYCQWNQHYIITNGAYWLTIYIIM